MTGVDPKKEISRITQVLDAGQLNLLLEMARAMTCEIQHYVHPESDILVPEFAGNFSNRLIIHHATCEEKFKKKSFEYAFCAASRSANRAAAIVSDPTNPGADVIVDGVKFSLKTEAAKSIRSDKITISKLMEAAWMKTCQTKYDFAAGTRERIVSHLENYERIIMLRAFSVKGDAVRYDFVEIPRDMLLSVRHVTSTDFTDITQARGTRAIVKYRGKNAFSLVMDGSDDKITISNLFVSLCVTHGSWTVPTAS